MAFLQLPHLGDRELAMDGMRGIGLHQSTALSQPGIEFYEGAEAPSTCLDPDAPAAILHIFLNYAFLPARSDVAEIRIKQVVAAHGGESSVDDALLAALDLVHGSAHVVVNAAPSDTAQRFEGSRVSVE